MEIDVMKWALQQGGMTVVAFGGIWVLWKVILFWRADVKDQMAALLAVVKESTTANQESAAASRATKEAIDRLTVAIQSAEIRAALPPAGNNGGNVAAFRP